MKMLWLFVLMAAMLFLPYVAQAQTETTVLTLTPRVTANHAYATGKTFGAVDSFTVRKTKTFTIQTVTVIDSGFAGMAGELWLLTARVGSKDTATWEIDSTDMQYVLAVIPFTHSYAATPCVVYYEYNVDAVIQVPGAPGTRQWVWYRLVARGSGTPTSPSAVKVKILALQ